MNGMLLPHSHTYQRVTDFAGKLPTVFHTGVSLSCMNNSENGSCEL